MARLTHTIWKKVLHVGVLLSFALTSIVSPLTPTFVASAQSTLTVNNNAPRVTKAEFVRYKESPTAAERLAVRITRDTSQASWNTAFQYYELNLFQVGNPAVAEVTLKSNTLTRMTTGKDEFILPVNTPVFSSIDHINDMKLGIRISPVYNMSDGSLQRAVAGTEAILEYNALEKSNFSTPTFAKEGSGLRLGFTYDTSREAKNNNGNGINGWIFKQGDTILDQGPIGSYTITNPLQEARYSVVTTFTDGKQREFIVDKVNKDANFANYVMSLNASAESAAGTISWTKVPGAARYSLELYRSGETAMLKKAEAAGDSDGYRFSELSPDTFYAVSVLAVSSTGQFIAKGDIQFRTTYVASTDLTPKNGAVIWKYNNDKTYRLQWEGGVEPFIIEVWKGSSKVRTENSWYTRTIDIDVDTNASYEVRVFNKSDFDAAKYDKRSTINFSTGTAATTTTNTTAATTKPTPPSSVTIASEQDGMRVSWSPVSNASSYDVVLYEVTGSKEVKKYSGLASKEVKFLTTDGTGIAPNTKYFAAVWANNNVGTSGYAASGGEAFIPPTTSSSTTSTSGTTTAPVINNLNQPGNVQFDASKNEISWTSVKDAGSYSYELNRGECTNTSSGANCTWGLVKRGSALQSPVRIAGLTGNTQYQFVLQAQIEVPVDPAQPNGEKKTISSTKTITQFATAKGAEKWDVQSIGTPDIVQVDGIEVQNTNGVVVIRYKLPKMNASTNGLKLQLLTTDGSGYDLMTKNFTATATPEGRIEIPLSNIQGVSQIAQILRTNGPSNVWFKFVGLNGSATTGDVRTSDSFRLPEPGDVTITSSAFSTSAAGGTNTSAGASATVGSVNNLAMVYDAANTRINITWDQATGAAGYEVIISGDMATTSSTGVANFETFSQKLFSTQNKFSISSPLAGKTYTAKIRAVATDGVTMSQQVTKDVTTPVWKPYPSAADINALNVTTTASASSQTVTATIEGSNGQSVSIPGNTISWTGISDTTFTNYRVFIRKKEANPVDWQYAANYDAAKGTTYRVVGLLPSTDYEYYVAAQYLILDTDGKTTKTLNKRITDILTLKTLAQESQPEDPSLSNAYARAKTNRDYTDRELSNVTVEAGAYLKSKNSSTLTPLYTVASNPSALQLRAGTLTAKEHYKKITLTPDQALNAEAVYIRSSTNGVGPLSPGGGTKAAFWVIDRTTNGQDLGSCVVNVFPYCNGTGNAGDSYQYIKIAFDKLKASSRNILIETMSLPSGSLRTSYNPSGVQVTEVEYNNQLIGWPLNFEFEIPEVSSADLPQVALQDVRGGSENLSLYPGRTTTRNLDILIQPSANTQRCEIRENNGAWEQIACANNNLLQTVPYTLKTTTSGNVTLQLRAINNIASTESRGVIIVYDTQTPTISLSGVPASWSSEKVFGIEAKCDAGDANCLQPSITTTNLLSEAQQCSDLKTIAPAQTWVECDADNNYCKDLRFDMVAGTNPTYICAKSRNASGVEKYAQKQLLRVDTATPDLDATIEGAQQSGASFFVKNNTVSLKLNRADAGKSGQASCTIGGDVTGSPACPTAGQSVQLTLSSGDGTKKVSVSLKNNAGKTKTLEFYVKQDASAPAFAANTSILAFDKSANGTVKITPAISSDTNLDRIELAFTTASGNVALPADLFAAVLPNITVEGNKIIIRANEAGVIPQSYLTDGLALRGLPVDASGTAIAYTVTQKVFDRAGNESEAKQTQFTLRDAVSTETVSITSGSVSLPATAQSSILPVDIKFSASPVYYTVTKNGSEGAKIAFNGSIALEPGTYTGILVKFYDAQNRKIGNDYGPFATTISAQGAIAALGGSSVIRTKDRYVSIPIESIDSTSDKVTYKVTRGGQELTTGERQKANYATRFDITSVALDPNSTNDVYVTMKDADGKETIFKKTYIHDDKAPVVKNIQSEIANTDKPKWKFSVEDAAGTPVKTVLTRLVNLTTGEYTDAKAVTAANNQFDIQYADIPMRPGHEYVLEVTTEDELGNKEVTRSTGILTKGKTSRDNLDMLQRAVNIDTSKITTDNIDVTLSYGSKSYTARMPRGKQVVFYDILARGKEAGSNQSFTRLPVGRYQMVIKTVGLSQDQTQAIDNFIVEPYFADANGDLNGDGKIGQFDRALYVQGVASGKYPVADSVLTQLSATIDTKLAEVARTNGIEFLRN